MIKKKNFIRVLIISLIAFCIFGIKNVSMSWIVLDDSVYISKSDIIAKAGITPVLYINGSARI